MIKLYLYRLGGFLCKAALSSKAEKNRLISETAYRLLEERITELTGIDAVISKTEKGKPYIVDSPLFISISHTENTILLAVSDGEIGVDAEAVRTFSVHTKERLFSDNEQKFINSGNADERATILWTLREAICKATGEGFSDWFFGCNLVDENLEPLNCISRNQLSLKLRTIIFDDCICSVAAAADADSVEIYELDL